jgi:hypothetical protein
MVAKEQRAKEIMDAIMSVLVNDWDPIGVMDDPDWPRDEYDSYIGEIYKLLAQHESAEFIARHLCLIEENRMGLGCPATHFRLPVAQKLKAINVSVQV